MYIYTCVCVYLCVCVYISNKNVHITLTIEKFFVSIAIFYGGELKEFLKLKWSELYSVSHSVVLRFLILLAHFHI